MIRGVEREKPKLEERSVLELLNKTGVVKELKIVAKERKLKDPEVIKNTIVVKDYSTGKTEIHTSLRLCWDWFYSRGSGWTYQYISVKVWNPESHEPKLAILGEYRGEGNVYLGGAVLPINRSGLPTVDQDKMREAIKDAIDHPQFMPTPQVTGPNLIGSTISGVERFIRGYPY